MHFQQYIQTIFIRNTIIFDMQNNSLNIMKEDHTGTKTTNERWTKTQHDRFMKALQKYGRDWVNVQRYVKTRNLSQVRSHAQKVFLKMPEEDIQAMIAGQGDSEDEQKFSKFETVKSKIANKQSGILKQTNCCLKKIKREQKTGVLFKESLLDIFKRAIEHQTMELQQSNMINSHSKQGETDKGNTLFLLREHESKAQEHESLHDQKVGQNFLQQPKQNIIHNSQKHQIEFHNDGIQPVKALKFVNFGQLE